MKTARLRAIAEAAYEYGVDPAFNDHDPSVTVDREVDVILEAIDAEFAEIHRLGHDGERRDDFFRNDDELLARRQARREARLAIRKTRTRGANFARLSYATAKAAA